jgi:ABC-2 type transport system permease protein
MSTVHTTPRAAVYDRGYRPYQGPRGGRREARLALWRLSVRRALGLRRSWRQKVAPWLLLAAATVPAVVYVGMAYSIRNDPYEMARFDFITYREYFNVSTLLVLFVALTAPDVVCPDRARRVLPLLFSRPLTGVDYVLAKVGAITTVVFGFVVVPQVVLFVGHMLVADGALDYFTDNAEVLWQVPVAAALFAVYYAVLGVAVASLTDRRVVAGVAIAGVTFVSGIVVAALAGGDGTTPFGVLNLLGLPLDLRDLVFEGELTTESALHDVDGGEGLAVLGYTAVVLVGAAILLHRYREIDL